MKNIKKIGVFLLSVFILGTTFSQETFAASGRVAVSSASGNVGSTVTISCTASVSGASIGAADVTLSYDPSALTLTSCSDGASGGSGGIYFSSAATGSGQSSLSFTMNFQIKKEGNFGVSVASYDVVTWDDEPVSVSAGGGSITGKAVTTNNPPSGGGTTTPTNPGNTQTNKDSNNKLKSLQVSPGSLSPAFNANTTSYKVNVPEGTTEIIVSAAAQSSKANVSVTGHKNIQPGTNTVKAVVTAENGTTRVYILTVICGEATTNEEPDGEPEKIQMNGTDHTINEAFTDDAIPTGFARAKITYKEKEYEALKHEKGELLLVNLQNEAGNTFYIFNEETQEFYDFVQISFLEGRYIVPLELDDREQFADYETTTVTLQDKQFDAWKVDEDYSIIRAMDSEGEIVLYQYDSLDGTLQRYAGVVEQEPIGEPEETKMTVFSFLEKYHLYIIAGLGAIILALIIALVCVAVKKRNKQNDEFDSYAENSYVEPKKQPKEVEEKPKKRKHDARRRKAIKRLQKQQMRENR